MYSFYCHYYHYNHYSGFTYMNDFSINPWPRRKSRRLCASSPSALRRCLVASGASPRARRRKPTTGKHCLQRTRRLKPRKHGGFCKEKWWVLPGKKWWVYLLPAKKVEFYQAKFGRCGVAKKMKREWKPLGLNNLGWLNTCLEWGGWK